MCDIFMIGDWLGFGNVRNLLDIVRLIFFKLVMVRKYRIRMFF